MKPIHYGQQSITQDDIDAVVNVLNSDYLTQGPQIKKFEQSFANYVGADYAVAVSNGTAALHLSALTMNISSGDKVITTPITFAATANCIRYCGGDVIFVDIDPITYCLDIDKVEELLKRSPPETFKGIIPVDFAGYAVNMEKYRNLADRYGLWIIEDACHAPGGYFTDSKNQKQPCGNGNFTDLSVFSFHPVKHITCGEGGMITTNNKELYKKLLLFRTHGITRDPHLLKENHGRWYYEMQELGYNYRITDFQAALGQSQLKRANEGLHQRRIIANNYYDTFNNKPFIIGQSGYIAGHAYHLYVIEVQNRHGLYEYLRENNIFSQIHYIPVHQMPYYRQFGWKTGDFPVAENYYSRCISLPMYPGLTEEEQMFVIEKIQRFYQ